MKFEKPNISENNTEDKEEAPENEIELSPAMQELYEEIIAEQTDENKLKENAKDMNATERLKILGQAIKRVGQISRKMAIVAFATFGPALAENNTDKTEQIKEELFNEIKTEINTSMTEINPMEETWVKQQLDKLMENEESKELIKKLSEGTVAATRDKDKNILGQIEILKKSFSNSYGLNLSVNETNGSIFVKLPDSGMYKMIFDGEKFVDDGTTHKNKEVYKLNISIPDEFK